MFPEGQSAAPDHLYTSINVVRDFRLVCSMLPHPFIWLIVKSSRSHILSDPTSFEEPLLDSTLSVIVGDNGELISASQLGLGTAGTQDPLITCIAAAKNRHSYLGKHIYDS